LWDDPALSVAGRCREYPQEGQPFVKVESSPEKPHFGQRTAEKYLPHVGHLFVFEATSVPQLLQKKRGFF
jgi:hypothetical protein